MSELFRIGGGGVDPFVILSFGAVTAYGESSITSVRPNFHLSSPARPIVDANSFEQQTYPDSSAGNAGVRYRSVIACSGNCRVFTRDRSVS
ncbi:MAG: hypothetical protein M3070_03680 [Actinomycetota bacterium]|nr:hypothetical protein [Actinomycetota bacterium]